MQKKNNKKKVQKEKFKKWMKKVKTVGKIEHLRKVLFIRNSMIKSRAKNSHTRASTHTHTPWTGFCLWGRNQIRNYNSETLGLRQVPPSHGK